MYQPFFSYQREACSSAVVPEAASAPPQLSAEDAALLHAPPVTSEAVPTSEAAALDPASEVAEDADDVAELLPPPDEAFCP